MAIIKSGATTDELTVDPVSKAARVTLYDPAGNVIQSVLDPLLTKYDLGVCMRQNVFASALNSSTASILSGANFPGASETTLGVAGIQVNTYLNQPHTVTVYQSSEGSNWYIADSWPVPTNLGISRTVQATDSFYKVVVTNTGSGTATVVAIATALCPVVEALPRALTSGGNLKVTPAADWQDAATVTGLYACSAFRTLGAASSPQNLFALLNPAASTKNLVVRQLTVASDSTAALTSVAQQAILSKPASLPTGGTALTPVKYKSSYAAAVGTPIGATASDGGGATAITATAGVSIWQQYLDRPQTAAGWYGHPTYSMVPDVGADLRQIILAPGESVLVQLVTSVPATTHLLVNCAWTEYLSL
jgi:hypothetical protein